MLYIFLAKNMDWICYMVKPTSTASGSVSMSGVSLRVTTVTLEQATCVNTTNELGCSRVERTREE